MAQICDVITSQTRDVITFVTAACRARTSHWPCRRSGGSWARHRHPTSPALGLVDGSREPQQDNTQYFVVTVLTICVCQIQVNGKWTAFIQRFPNQWLLKALYNIAIANIHAFMHPFSDRRRCQPCKATASSSGAVRVRCLGTN